MSVTVPCQLSPGSPTAASHQRVFPRFAARGTGRCRLRDQPFQPEQPAQLVDISQGGIGFVVRTAVQVGDVLLLSLERAADRPLRVEAEVRWVVPQSGGRFRIGCSWVHRLAYGDMLRFSGR